MRRTTGHKAISMAVLAVLVPMVSIAQPMQREVFPVIERAIESPAVELVFDAQQKVVQVVANACFGCTRQSFLPSRDLQVRIGRKAVKPTERLSGHAATVVYSVETNEVLRIMFYAADWES